MARPQVIVYEADERFAREKGFVHILACLDFCSHSA